MSAAAPFGQCTGIIGDVDDGAEPATTGSATHRRPEVLGPPTVAVTLWTRLLRVIQRMQQRQIRQLQGAGLSLAQFDLLAQVGSHEGLTQGELADALLVTKGNVAQLVDRMEDAGLIRRERAGRTKRLFLTTRGTALFEQVVPAHEALVTRLLASLDPDELEHLLGVFRRLDRELRRTAP